MSGMTITEFIAARLDEDEAAARAAKRGPWHADGGHVYATHPTDEVVDYAGSSAEHIARHDPARVLAQVAAMRAIVDELTSRERQDDSEEGLWHKVGYDRAAFDVLRHLAAIWSSHPDYDPAWAPEGE